MNHNRTRRAALTGAHKFNQLVRDTSNSLGAHHQKSDSKRRFISSPLRLLKRNYKRLRAVTTLKRKPTVNSSAVELMKTALQQRIVTRRLRDLKKYVQRRRLPREQSLPP